MIADLKPYPVMKDSGVEWLGDVPAHWTVKRGKVLFRCVDVRSSTGEEELLTVSSERGVIPRSSATVTMFKAESYVGYKLCWPCDLVINSLWAWARGLGVSRHHGIISSAYGVYRLRPPFTEYHAYFHELVRSTPFNWELQVRSKGIWISRLQLTDEAFLGAPFPLPPSQEQAAIVRYLDHVARQIQSYILAKQKLIALLEEQRQAVIHQAVTGQIDVRTGRPYLAYKDSGVEWLGDVPEHWEVRRARYIFREVDLRSQDGSEQHLSMSQSLGLVPSHLVENRTLVSESYAGGKLCRPGDLVLNRLKAHLGVFARARQPGVISADYTVLRPNGEAKTEYFEQVLRSPSCRRELRIRAKGIVEGFWRLYTDDLYDIRLPLPPEDEQRLIIRWIESVSTRKKRRAASASREIELLREYRTRLIADVVTGKLDVREAVSRLPDEFEELEALNETGALHDSEEEATEDLVASSIDDGC